MASEESLSEEIDVSADDSVMQTAALFPAARDDSGTTPDSVKKSTALLPSTGDENGTNDEPVRGNPAIPSSTTTDDDVKPEEGKDGETDNSVIAKFSQDVIGILKKSSILDDPLYISQLVDDIKMVENRTGVALEGEKASELPLSGAEYVDTEDKEATPAKVETEDTGESVATDCDIHKQEETISCEQEEMAEKIMKGEKISAPTKIGTDHAGQSQVNINKQEHSAISTQENERTADKEGESATVETLVETGFPGESIATTPIDIDKQQAQVVASREDGTEQDKESVKGLAVMTVQTEGSRDLVATQSDICKEEKPAMGTRDAVGSLKDVGVPALETDYMGGLRNTQYDKHKQDELVTLTRVETKTFQAVEKSDFESCQEGSTSNSSFVCQESVDLSEKKDFNQIDAKSMEHEQDIALIKCRKETEGLSTRKTCDISNAHEKGILHFTHTNLITDKEVSGEIELRPDLENMDTRKMCGVMSNASGKENFPLVYAKPVIGLEITGEVEARVNMEGICTSEAHGTTSYASDKGDKLSSDQVKSVEIEHGESGQADDVIRSSHYANLSPADISMGNIVTNTVKDAKMEIQEDKNPASLVVEHQAEIGKGEPETEILATLGSCVESEASSSKDKQECVSACYLASQKDEVEQVDKSLHKIIHEEHHAGDHIPEPHSLMDSEKEISVPSLVGGNSSGAHIVSDPTLLSDCYAKPCVTQEIEQHDVSIEESMNVDSSTSPVAEVAAVSPTTIHLLNAKVHVSSTSESDNVMERPCAKGLLNHDENAHNFCAPKGSLSHNPLEMISSERNHEVSRIISDEPTIDDGQMELEETKGEGDQCVIEKEEIQGDYSDQELPMEAQELDNSAARVSESDNENDDFNFGDLVWAKVRSHPWWPAQIFNPEDASKSAIQSRKTGRFLVAFFGDCTFAWVQPSELTEFRSHFKAKAKKTTKIFCKAVDEALEEICQRSELGLVGKLKNYDGTLYSKGAFIDEEVGILKVSRIQKHRDVLSSVNKFSPDRTLKFLKDVACSPFSSWNASVDMSELRGHAYGLRAYIISSKQEGKEGDESLMTHGKRLFSSLDFASDECQEAKKLQQKNTEATPGKRKDSAHYESDDKDTMTDVNNEHFVGDDAGFGKDKSSILKHRKDMKGSKRTSCGLATKAEEIKDEGEEATHEIVKRTKKSKNTEPPASLEELEMITEMERKNGMGKVSKVTKSVQGKNTGAKGGSTNKSSIYMKFGASMRKVASELTGALPLGKCLDKSNVKGAESIPEKQASFEPIAHGKPGEVMKSSKQEQGANVKEIPIKKAARDGVRSRKRQEVVPRASKSKFSKIAEKETVKHFGEHDFESDLSKGNVVESPKHIEKGMIKYARRPPRKSKGSSIGNEGGEVLVPENPCILPLGEEKDMECYRPESPASEARGDCSPSPKHESTLQNDIELENQRNDEEGGNIQDQLMTLLRQVSVIVATPPHNSDTASK